MVVGVEMLLVLMYPTSRRSFVQRRRSCGGGDLSRHDELDEAMVLQWPIGGLSDMMLQRQRLSPTMVVLFMWWCDNDEVLVASHFFP